MIQHLHKTLFLREKISIKLVAFPVDSLSQFSTSVVPKRSVFLCFLSDSVELMTSTQYGMLRYGWSGKQAFRSAFYTSNFGRVECNLNNRWWSLMRFIISLSIVWIAFDTTKIRRIKQALVELASFPCLHSCISQYNIANCGIFGRNNRRKIDLFKVLSTKITTASLQ